MSIIVDSKITAEEGEYERYGGQLKYILFDGHDCLYSI